MTRAEQTVRARMQQIREMVESGATEMTGKGIRASGDNAEFRGQIIGRHGGMNLPELARAGMAPGVAAKAVRLGKGKRFKRLYAAVYAQLDKEGALPREPRKASGKKSVQAHAGNKKCRHCVDAHTRGQHRFHGAGSFHATHAFSFNPGAGAPPGFAEYLVYLGYLPGALRPDLVAQLYSDKKLKAGFREWEKGRGLFAPGSGAERGLFNPMAKKKRKPRVCPGCGRGTQLSGRDPYGNIRCINCGEILVYKKNPSTRTSSDVRSPTRTSTSTEAETYGNVTVTGGAGRGANTRVTIRRNPPPTRIYQPTRGVVISGMQKGPGHRCDAACKRAGHKYRHLFKKPIEIIGLPNGDVLLKPGRRKR